jgi:hypothetical protein
METLTLPVNICQVNTLYTTLIPFGSKCTINNKLLMIWCDGEVMGWRRQEVIRRGEAREEGSFTCGPWLGKNMIVIQPVRNRGERNDHA